MEEVVRRFRAQMEHVPKLSLYDRDKASMSQRNFSDKLTLLLNMVYDY